MSEQPVIAVFGASAATPGDGLYEAAFDVGSGLARAGYAVTNGGYTGTMQAVSQGAASASGRVIGVTAPSLFPGRPSPNPYLTEEIEAGSLTQRIHIMVELAAAAVVLPGSIGTFTELTAVWNDSSIAPLRAAEPRPIVAFRDPWQAIVEPIESTLGMTRGLIVFVDDAASAVSEIQRRF